MKLVSFYSFLSFNRKVFILLNIPIGKYSFFLQLQALQLRDKKLQNVNYNTYNMLYINLFMFQIKYDIHAQNVIKLHINTATLLCTYI